MKRVRRPAFLFAVNPAAIFIAFGLGQLAAALPGAEAPVTISVQAGNLGVAIPPDFSGLSFEVALVLPNEGGVHYFRADNLPLITLFHTLGIKSLRIGGNTSDRDAKRLPDESDLDSLFAFASAAGVKVIYCLRLHGGDAQTDAKTAKYIMDHYAGDMDCFSIGQEPSAYPKPYTYSDYHMEWKEFAGAIIAAVPDVRLCGPSVHNNAEWARKFIADFGHENHVMLITEHLYPGGAGGKVPTPEIGRDRMLSTNFVRAYGKLHDGFAPQAASNGLPYRLEEVNNYFNGGATNVSNTFASALWGLDFMYWWAVHGAAGLNFHTGDRVAAGSNLHPSRYTAFFSTTNGYIVRPLGYGIKTFDLGCHGDQVPMTPVNLGGLNLSAYGVIGHDGRVYLTVINKEHGAGARDARLSLNQSGFARGEIIFLTAPGNDIAADSGETLGGAAIQSDGTWSGKWTPLNPPVAKTFSAILPASSAAVIRLSGN